MNRPTVWHRALLCVDNSTESDHAAVQAAVIGRAFGSEIVAAHVYAARLHDRRFTDMEPNLPEAHRGQEKLEASRRMHAALIGRGLEMISNSYLEATRARLDGLPVECRSIEGTHYVELTRESKQGYDLTIIGARGLGLAAVNGEVPATLLGGVSERMLRRVRTDLLLVRDDRPPEGTILVAIDGSPPSYGALRKAIILARALGAGVEVVTAFDPDYHPMAFRSISGVLSEKHSKVFRFQEQEKLHNEIIDHGLEGLYEGYLENARAVARGKGFDLKTRLLTGKPAWAVAARARTLKTALLVVGRFGRHRTDGLDVGHTAETIAHLAPANVLVVHDDRGELPLTWTAEAKARLRQVPEFMRPMVQRAIEAHARARELIEVTAAVVQAAKTTHGVPMPGHQPEHGTEP